MFAHMISCVDACMHGCCRLICFWTMADIHVTVQNKGYRSPWQVFCVLCCCILLYDCTNHAFWQSASLTGLMTAWQGSAHTGQRWSAPTTTQPILPPLTSPKTLKYNRRCIQLKAYSAREATTQTILGMQNLGMANCRCWKFSENIISCL